ncbi:UDP-N-acetylmuramoyl-L-alanyl-D-glutamate--2,6-diaminopimelate ligase [Rarobacter incanus]
MRPRAVFGKTLGDVVDRFGGALVLENSAHRSVTITGLAVGTGDLEPGDLFVGLRGLKTHGAKFVDRAVAAGAVAVLTDDEGGGLIGADPAYSDLPLLIFRNRDEQREVTGEIAAWFYDYPCSKLVTIGVTGTNGKTTTTYFIDAAMARGVGTTALLGTVELRVGDVAIPSPRTTVEAPVLQSVTAMAAERGAGALTTEVSSHALALQRIAGAQFDVVGFTNLQRDHLDFHVTMENYFHDKARLFSAGVARRGVVCVDDEWGQRLAAEAKIPVATVATHPESAGYDSAQWRVTDAHVTMGKIGSSFTLRGPDGIAIGVHCPLPGIVNVANAALAMVIAHSAGVSLADAAAGIESITAIPGRMERVVDDPDRPLVIVDYAHTPDALALALEGVRAITPGKLVIVFGSDGDRDRGKRPIMGEIAARLADELVVTDENPRSEDPAAIRAAILAGVASVRPGGELVHEVSPRWDAVAVAIAHASAGDTVIITGKGHEPTQEVAGVFTPYNDRDAARAALGATN